MRRIQLYLDEADDDALAIEARQRGVPKAALIREYLSEHVHTSTPQADDPSAKLIGVYEGDQDESAAVDDAVYGR